MSFEDAPPVADALLYEGYALYPYRATAAKNRVRFPFGGAYPAAYARAQSGADRSLLFCECLARVEPETKLRVRLRCLLLPSHGASSPGAWREAVEAAHVAELGLTPGARRVGFELGGIPGLIHVECTELGPGLARLRVGVENMSTLPALERDAALEASFLSIQLELALRAGSFVSRLEPPAELQAASDACENGGLYPVLVGQRGAADAMLASPIILYDYPEISGKSPGDLFDATEIDEILSLRIQTLTEDEKREMRALEPRTRALLERTEALDAGDFARLHGELRGPSAAARSFAPGTRVRLRPRRRADIFDLALAGRSATVRSLEEDAEGTAYLCVTIDDDPGADLGVSGQPGHRFFFGLDEVEPLSPSEVGA